MIEGLLRRFGYVKESPVPVAMPESIGARIIGGYRRSVPRRGTVEMLRAYRDSPMLQAVVRKIAFSVATVEWWAAAKLSVEGEETRLDDHMAARMLMRGTPFMSGLHARMLSQVHMELVGETFEVLERNLVGAPVQKWPLPPHWVRATPLPGRPFFDICPPNGGEVMTLPMRDVIWRRDLDPERPYERGTGVGYALGDELNADEFAAKHMAASLANRARPDIIVSGSKDAPLDNDDVERMREVWSDRFGGPERAGKPMFSSAPVDVHDLTPSFRELDLTSLRTYERDIIVSVFGVPPEMVGIISNSNRATIESAEFLFTKHVIRPRLEMAAADYNAQLAPQYDDRLRLRFDDPVDEDRDFQREAMQGMPDAFMLDEHRALAGYQPLPDGAGEVFPLAFARDYRRLDDEPTAFAMGAATAAASAQEQRGTVIKASQTDIENAVAAVDDAIFRRILLSALEETVATFGESALQDVGIDIDFDLFDPAVRSFIQTNASERSRLIGDTTRDILRGTLAEGVAAGESTDKLVARIREAISGASPSRARTISRTEIVRASNYATTEAHRQAGIDQREWLATRDDRVRDSHAALDGKRVGMEERFEINGRSAMYPGDFGVAEEDINCRCGVVPIIGFEGDGEARAALWRKYDGGRRQFENMLARQTVAGFAEQERAVVAAVSR